MIIAAVDDMFFASKIRAVAEQLKIDVRFARNLDSVLSGAHETRPELVVVDLQSQKINAIELAKALKADADLKDIPLLGFFSHVLADLQQAAIQAGFDRVIPRSVFSRDLAEILSVNSE